MQIREFKTSDAQELGILFYSTIRQINSRDYTTEQVVAWAPEHRDPIEWQRSFENKYVVVAVDGSKICGFGELENSGHIDRFYVHHECIGAGVGRKIYQALEARAFAWSLTRLFVEASITALPFFQSMGFKNEQRQTVTLRGVDFTNYRMEKNLVLPNS